MFNKENRYITKGVNEDVDIRLQVLIWGLIDRLKEIKDLKIDYLQVFNICKNKDKIILEHKQEVQEYKKLYEINNKEIDINGNIKLFIIDNNEYSTMLLAEEY